ncbi:D-serine ammonia-lyase [Tindallia californiensis]|uniref:Probable D-serine dehydratase n=1 Tax=Tindallia californiensis TaxID=159292 RepID=A0A1H3MJE6_9FIRM|nr:D-serine ammonia-lyase [Tindallia californiensis]SDY76801.1 D-serine ammonia-lyase [Tindallia californiensis]
MTQCDFVNEWKRKYPEIKKILKKEPFFWINPKCKNASHALDKLPLTTEDIMDASNRLERFAPYLAQVFDEVKASSGIIESSLQEIPKMKNAMEKRLKHPLAGDLYLKMDHQLPISGSIKARGGIYEVLKHAERLAMKEGLLFHNSDYRVLDSQPLRNFFSQYSISVGSTGNLGLSIGIMGAKLGFRVTVHMSRDARKWKKEKLRQHGVKVREYDSDFGKAVEEGRRQAQQDQRNYFIDDENSKDLFLGYAVAALRLKKQLEDKKIIVDESNPLFVYLPCGVGGGPGGIAFGLKQIYGDRVHCYFAEPTQAPAVLLGMLTGLKEKVSATDFGIDSQTEADGLAVSRPSGLVCQMMEELLDGVFTVDDALLFKMLAMLSKTEGIQLEPSALAGMPGPFRYAKDAVVHRAVRLGGYDPFMKQATHIVWATGGAMVPEDEMKQYISKGNEMLSIEKQQV